MMSKGRAIEEFVNRMCVAAFATRTLNCMHGAGVTTVTVGLCNQSVRRRGRTLTRQEAQVAAKKATARKATKRSPAKRTAKKSTKKAAAKRTAKKTARKTTKRSTAKRTTK